MRFISLWRLLREVRRARRHAPVFASRRAIVGSEFEAAAGAWNKPSLIEMERRLAPRTDAFLIDIRGVCEAHGLTISHQDDGAFIIEPYNAESIHWLNGAQIMPSIEGPSSRMEIA